MTGPRYDEQFRRGYAGPPVQPPADTSASTSAPDAPQWLPEEDPGRPARAGDDRAVDESSGIGAEDADRRDPGGARPFRRNPFAIALLSLGLLTLIVGVWLAEQSTKLGDAGTPDQQAVTEVAWQLAAPVLTCGVIAIVVWLVLGAFVVATHRRGA